MKKLLILVLSFLFISASEPEENLELRIFNDSKFKIEKIKINYKGQETEFKDIEAKSYSEIRKIKGLWKDNCYDLTIFKKRFFAKNYWAHNICYPIDHIGSEKIESGKYTLRVKIKRYDEEKFVVDSEYISENKNE